MLKYKFIHQYINHKVYIYTNKILIINFDNQKKNYSVSMSLVILNFHFTVKYLIIKVTVVLFIYTCIVTFKSQYISIFNI